MTLLANCEEGSSRFQCVVCTGYSGSAEFNIVEQNSFKQISHLNLKFRKGRSSTHSVGNDHDVISFLSDKLKLHKQDGERKQKELNEKTTALDNERHQV